MLDTRSCGIHTIWNISNERIKKERPAQRVSHRFLELVELVVLVSNSLLIDAHTLNSQDLVLFTQPPAVELIIRHNPKEQEAHASRQHSSNKEDNLPRLDDRARLAAPNSNTVRDAATEDLRKAVEAEPDGCARALFFLRIPLRGEKGEAGRHGGFEDAQEETDGDGSCVVFYSCEAR